MAGFLPTSRRQRTAMLASVGLPDADQLLAVIPESVRMAELPLCPELAAEPLPEMSVRQRLQDLASQNLAAADCPCFLGAGAYDHFQPAAIRHLLLRQEFYTAYTPYQPEISQGTLQGIFEFQSLVCRLTGLDVANSSMYDGASAAAEALLMACRATGRQRVVIAKSLHPQTIQVVQTYLEASGHEVIVLAPSGDGTWAGALAANPPDEQTAAVLVQSPNFYGLIESLEPIAGLAHQAGALAIASCDPISLALLKPPGEAGMDIAVGEVQPLGNALNFGGPYAGYLAAREELLRRMPGRIVGETVDREGRRAFVLTIQAREQHIRREKATSNICTNEALCALAATIYLALLGNEGLHTVAAQSARKAAYLRQLLLDTGWFRPLTEQPFFREFALILDRSRWPVAASIAGLNHWLSGKQIIGGLDLGSLEPGSRVEDGWLLAVTEKRSIAEMTRLIDLIGQYRSEGGTGHD